MDKTDGHSVIEGALGSFALFLIVLTGWAVERQQSGAPTGALLARFVLAGVATIGWAVDRLPWPAPWPETVSDAATVAGRRAP